VCAPAPLSPAADGYLRLVYGRSTPAELDIAQRLEVRLAARDGQALFVEIAEQLQPEPGAEPETYHADPRRSRHPGRIALGRLAGLGLLGVAAVLVSWIAGHPSADVAAIVAALACGLYASWTGTKLVAFLLLDRRSARALGALGIAAGLGLVFVGAYLAVNTGEVTPVRRSPWVVVGLALAGGAAVGVLSTRLVVASLGRDREER
jgi:hypothetical protein